jgi:hypothetical protein
MDGEGTTPLIAACRNGFNDQGAYLPLIEVPMQLPEQVLNVAVSQPFLPPQALLDAGASATHENERGACSPVASLALIVLNRAKQLTSDRMLLRSLAQGRLLTGWRGCGSRASTP